MNIQTRIIVGTPKSLYEDPILTQLVSRYDSNYKIEPNNPDFLLVAPEKGKEVSISQTKNIANWLQTKPFSHKLKLLIVIANRLNIQVQNSLLKVLEEPAPDNLIVLYTSNPSRLLDTVKSRAIIVEGDRNHYPEESKSRESAEDFLSTQSYISRMKIVEDLKIMKDRKQTILFLEELLYLYTQKIKRSNYPMAGAEIIIMAIKALESSTNIKLTIQAVASSMDLK